MPKDLPPGGRGDLGADDAREGHAAEAILSPAGTPRRSRWPRVDEADPEALAPQAILTMAIAIDGMRASIPVGPPMGRPPAPMTFTGLPRLLVGWSR